MKLMPLFMAGRSSNGSCLKAAVMGLPEVPAFFLADVEKKKSYDIMGRNGKNSDLLKLIIKACMLNMEIVGE